MCLARVTSIANSATGRARRSRPRREPDAPDQLGVSSVGPQRVEHRIDLHERQDLRMLLTGAVQPCEGGITIVETDVAIAICAGGTKRVFDASSMPSIISRAFADRRYGRTPVRAAPDAASCRATGRSVAGIRRALPRVAHGPRTPAEQPPAGRENPRRSRQSTSSANSAATS